MFALHVHAIVFLVFTLTSFDSLIERVAVRTTLDVLSLAGLSTYLVIALRRVYSESWTRTVLKTMLLSGVYLGFFAAGMAVLLFYSFLTF